MGETDGDEQLFTGTGQFDGQASAKRGRPDAKIDDAVQYPPSQAANQLGLSAWGMLEMQATDGAGGGRPRLILLGKATLHTNRREAICGIGLTEPATAVPVANRLYKKRPRGRMGVSRHDA